MNRINRHGLSMTERANCELPKNYISDEKPNILYHIISSRSYIFFLCDDSLNYSS